MGIFTKVGQFIDEKIVPKATKLAKGYIYASVLTLSQVSGTPILSPGIQQDFYDQYGVILDGTYNALNESQVEALEELLEEKHENNQLDVPRIRFVPELFIAQSPTDHFIDFVSDGASTYNILTRAIRVQHPWSMNTISHEIAHSNTVHLFGDEEFNEAWEELAMDSEGNSIYEGHLEQLVTHWRITRKALGVFPFLRFESPDQDFRFEHGLPTSYAATNKYEHAAEIIESIEMGTTNVPKWLDSPRGAQFVQLLSERYAIAHDLIPYRRVASTQLKPAAPMFSDAEGFVGPDEFEELVLELLSVNPRPEFAAVSLWRLGGAHSFNHYHVGRGSRDPERGIPFYIQALELEYSRIHKFIPSDLVEAQRALGISQDYCRSYELMIRSIDGAQSEELFRPVFEELKTKVYQDVSTCDGLR